jgi:nucleotide-binding universal stress UspA family protein
MPRILITTEGSSCSHEAVRRFGALFHPGHCEVYLLSVVPLANSPDGAPGAAEHYRRESDAAQEAIDLATADLMVAGFSAFGIVRVGAPADTILEVAREIRADLVVLGTHGRQGLDRLFKGSVAEDVLHRAPCAVFIYPYPAKAEAGAGVSIG